MKRLYQYLIRVLSVVRLRLWNIKANDVPLFTGCWPQVLNEGLLQLGNRCHFRSFRLSQRFVVKENAELILGDDVFINDGVLICATQSINIGSNTKIGDMTYIYDSDFHEIDSSKPVKQAPVTIGKNVWIAANCMILPGSEIGDHSVVAAGSVVTGKIPPKSLVAGVPAKIIKQLDMQEDWLRS